MTVLRITKNKKITKSGVTKFSKTEIKLFLQSWCASFLWNHFSILWFFCAPIDRMGHLQGRKQGLHIGIYQLSKDTEWNTKQKMPYSYRQLHFVSVLSFLSRFLHNSVQSFFPTKILHNRSTLRCYISSNYQNVEFIGRDWWASMTITEEALRY